MARKKIQEEHENHERYLVTYSDLITLLLAFFIILYAMSNPDAEKMKSVSQSLEVAFHNSASNSLMNMDLNNDKARTGLSLQEQKMMKAVKENNQLHQIKQAIEQTVKENPELAKNFSIFIDKDGLHIVGLDNVFFDSGSTVLSQNALTVLNQISELVAPLKNHVAISGHADNVPINNSQYASNWELSTSRATSVLRYMIANNPNLKPERFAAMGFGEYKPIASNQTEEGKKQNRRVEILISRTESEGLLQPDKK